MKAAEAKVGTKVLYLDIRNGQILKGVIKSDLILAPPGLCVILDLEEPGRGDTVALLSNLYTTKKELADDVEKEKSEYVNDVSKNINTLEDLLRFTFNVAKENNCFESGSSYSEKCAIQTIAAEKFGINLD